MKSRKAFNFYRSYWETAKKLEGEDRLKFYDALFEKQFLNKDPKLEGLSDLVYTSQKHSIDAQVKGYLDKTKHIRKDPMQGGVKGGIKGGVKAPSVQEEVQGKEKEEVQGKEKVKRDSVFNFKKEFLDLGVEKEILEDWLKVRKTKKATNSKTAFNGILKKIEASGLTANECIKISAENSWSGFNNKWIEEKEKSSAKKEKLNVTQRVLQGDYEEIKELILNASHKPEYKKISGE